MCAVAEQDQFDPMAVELGPMKRRHVRQVLRIEAQVYPRPWSASLFYQEIARRPDRVYLVAKLDNEVIGYGGLMTSGIESHITTIAVDPAFHRRKIGMRLMVGLIEAALGNGANTVSLEVRRSNEAAQTMYERFGFIPVGIRKGYYAETKEDAIVMLVENVNDPEYRQLLDDLSRSVTP